MFRSTDPARTRRHVAGSVLFGLVLTTALLGAAPALQDDPAATGTGATTALAADPPPGSDSQDSWAW